MELGVYIYACLYKARVSMFHTPHKASFCTCVHTCAHKRAARHAACLIICILGICADSPYLVSVHVSTLRVYASKGRKKLYTAPYLQAQDIVAGYRGYRRFSLHSFFLFRRIFSRTNFNPSETAPKIEENVYKGKNIYKWRRSFFNT